MEKKDDLMNKNQELIESQSKRIIELSLSNKKLQISNEKLMERLEMKIDMLVKLESEKKNLNQESTDADGADSDNE